MNRHSDNLENLTKLRQRKVTLEAEIRTLAAKDALTVDEEETFERSLGASTVAPERPPFRVRVHRPIR